LLSLALVAAKASWLGLLWEPIARAAAADVKSWAVADLVKLLLAVTRGKEHLRPEAREALLASAGSALTSELPDLAAVELVKLLLGLAGLGGSALLEATAKEAAIRLPDLSLPHLLLVTQGLAQGLSPEHPALLQALEFWPGKLKGAGGGASKGSTDAGLSADQLTKLVVATSPALKAGAAVAGSAHANFVRAVVNQLLARVTELSEVSREMVQAELAEGGALASSPRRQELLAPLLKLAKAKKARKASRSPSPGGGTAKAGLSKKQRKKQRR